jgi:hypothetical protein
MTRPPGPLRPAGWPSAPVACANRRNARSDVTIAFADQVLRSREWSTMNAVTLAASSPLTAPGPPIAARNAFACLE